MTQQTENHWHLDKRVPIALIAAIFAQSAAVVWWASSISAKVEANAAEIAELENTNERLARIETMLELVIDRLDRERANDR